MKKLILVLVATLFLIVSCGTKKAGNDADILPDEDSADEDSSEEEYVIVDDEEEEEEPKKGDEWEPEPETGSPCENFANTDGMIRYNRDGSFECGCASGFFWGHLGCKKILHANICTGQAKCYDWYNNIHKCADAGNLSGQDPYYSREGYCLKQNYYREIYYSDEAVIFDENLRIGWMNKISPGEYTWEEAADYCENLKYGGHDDWRLPKPEELVTITSKLREDVYLWSSGTLEKNNSLVWSLNSNQSMELRNKDLKAYVRCARRKKVADEGIADLVSHFKTVEINNVEVVRDIKSGIVWQKNFSDSLEWSDSMVFCEHSSYAGFSDWRLPNINELLSLANYKDGSVSDFPIDSSVLNFNPYFWSSTTNENVSSLPAYGLNFLNGQSVHLSRAQYNTVSRAVCIRNEPCRDGYWWTGEKCAESPCDNKPCEKVKHSDGTCGTEDFESFYCGCVDGYFWDGEKCVDPCDGNPCAQYERTTKECRGTGDSSYICGCEENYYWWGKNKGCLDKRPVIANLCTGQTKCYDEEKRIKCPAEGEKFYGQDAHYAALGTCVPKNYKLDTTVENEPVVHDFNTNLDWQGKIDSAQYWSWSMASSYCAKLDYGGHDDWRLPKFDELRSILDYNAAPLVSAKFFPDTPTAMFFSSTFPFEDNVYTVHFDDSAFGEFSLRDSYSGQEWMTIAAVRCVRGEIYEDEPRHMSEIHEGDETFYGDSVMGLLWAKIIPDQENQVVWADFLKYCEDMTALGLSDWRLANINELRGVSLEERYTRFGISSTSQLVNTEMVFGSANWSKAHNSRTYIVCVADNPCPYGEIWTGEKCIEDKCRSDVCASVEKSTKVCIPGGEGDPGYSCSCYENYRWDSAKLKCVVNDEE